MEFGGIGTGAGLKNRHTLMYVVNSISPKAIRFFNLQVYEIALKYLQSMLVVFKL